MRAHRSLALRWLLRASVPLALVGCVGCDASGSTEGGTPVQSDPCATGNLTPTWTTLYTCYFGPSGKAGCSGKTSCHGPPSPCSPPMDCLSGTTIWTCGPTRESCWQGMTTQQCFCPDASSPAGSFDAAIESGALDAAPESGPSDAASAETGTDGAATGACPSTCTALPAPPVPPGSSSDPTTTPLWFALRGAPSKIGQHDMPWTPPGAAPGYTFSAQDLDLISTWIREGAQDN